MNRPTSTLAVAAANLNHPRVIVIIMGRLLSTIAFVGLLVAAASAFTATKLSSTAISRCPSESTSLLPSIHNNKIYRGCRFAPIIATRMTSKDGGLPEEEKLLEGEAAAEKDATTSGTSGNVAAADKKSASSDDNKDKGFSLFLLPTLLFKFTIVMIVKFATDIIVFPLLWLYRLARLGKRKVVRGMNKLLGREDGGYDKKTGTGVNGANLNGDGASSSS